MEFFIGRSKLWGSILTAFKLGSGPEPHIARCKLRGRIAIGIDTFARLKLGPMMIARESEDEFIKFSRAVIKNLPVSLELPDFYCVC